MKTLAIIVPEPGKIEMEVFHLPAPSLGEVTLEAYYSTLSPGTEYTIVNGMSARKFPIRIGYSFCGRVVACGPGVTRLEVGQWVVTQGRHAAFINQDERFCTPLPDGIDLEQAAFFNLVCTAAYGVRQAGIQFGDSVVVLGQGLVGLLSAKLAQLAGGWPVIGVDLDESRLDISRRMGIPVQINGADQAGVRDFVAAQDGGIAVVLEATGARQPVELALDIIRDRGRIVLLSSTYGDEVVPFHRKLMMKGASLIGGYINSKPFSLAQTDVNIDGWPPFLETGARRYVGPGMWTSDEDIRLTMQLVKYGALDLRPLITHRFVPEQAVEAYQLVTSRSTLLVGGVIKWRDVG